MERPGVDAGPGEVRSRRLVAVALVLIAVTVVAALIAVVAALIKLAG